MSNKLNINLQFTNTFFAEAMCSATVTRLGALAEWQNKKMLELQSDIQSQLELPSDEINDTKLDRLTQYYENADRDHLELSTYFEQMKTYFEATYGKKWIKPVYIDNTLVNTTKKEGSALDRAKAALAKKAA